MVQVPENLVEHAAFNEDPVTALQYAISLCNKQLHSSSIDDGMSGTTAITCLIRGRMLYVGNVGDSRAIAAEMINGSLAAVPLSFDQTPFRYVFEEPRKCSTLTVGLRYAKRLVCVALGKMSVIV